MLVYIVRIYYIDYLETKLSNRILPFKTLARYLWKDRILFHLNFFSTDDFRIFCGDLGNEVTDEVLARAFSRYPSFVKSKVVRDKRTNKTKGYGFVSFKDPNDFVQAMREMNGKIYLTTLGWGNFLTSTFLRVIKQISPTGI